MNSLLSFQLETNQDTIAQLFPKCRPRDVNSNTNVSSLYHSLDNQCFMMNSERSKKYEEGERGRSRGEDSAASCTASSSSSGEEEEDEDEEGDEDEEAEETGGKNSTSHPHSGHVIVLHSTKGPTYKLRDSRIIEIAGGRELYSQSRSKASRAKSVASQRRMLLTSSSPREVTETVFAAEVHSVRMRRGLQGAILFDDIEEPSNFNIGDPNSPTTAISLTATATTTATTTTTNTTPTTTTNTTTNTTTTTAAAAATCTKVIGGLPIAEYEGSPRRYGPRGSTPTAEATHHLSATSTSPSTFDYLYEFSETRKVLEEFFKGNSPTRDDLPQQQENFDDLSYALRRQSADITASAGSRYVGLRLACEGGKELPCSQRGSKRNEDADPAVDDDDDVDGDNDDSDADGDGDVTEVGGLQVGLLGLMGHSLGRTLVLSPTTTDCESNPDCEVDSDYSLPPSQLDPIVVPETIIGHAHDVGESGRVCCAMPVLEDGLSSGHASDNDNNNVRISHGSKRQMLANGQPPAKAMNGAPRNSEINPLDPHDLSSLDPYGARTPPPPAPAPHRLEQSPAKQCGKEAVEATLMDIRQTLQRTKTLGNHRDLPPSATDISDRMAAELHKDSSNSPIWVPRLADDRGVVVVEEEEEPDTDLETDRLLGQQRTHDDTHGFYDEKEGWKKPRTRTVLPSGMSLPQHGGGDAVALETCSVSPHPPAKRNKEKDGSRKKGRNKEGVPVYSDQCELDSSVLIEGVLFRARYLGSTQLACEGQPTKTTRMMQAEEAVSRIKAPEGETQPSTEVDLFISTEKIMVLNTDLKEIMMDHALRTISYIADIGELVVLMARRRYDPHDSAAATTPTKSAEHETATTAVTPTKGEQDPSSSSSSSTSSSSRPPKMICHVFESEEAQLIAQSIGQAFQVAYMEFLKANGIEDHSFVKEMDYQEVLNSQEIFGDELKMFARKEMQKEVVVPKAKGEMLGVVIVESGWGSMLPTVVIANLAPGGAAARCGQLNIGDQIIAVNGISLVGLPLSTCQAYIKNSRTHTVVKLTVVPCAPVVEVKIRRPDTKYQLGFSVQNGVICSLLRGGIAERGGVRVGHRIIEINNQSVVAVPHERIVNLLATSVGEILMKTMPTSMFRLLTGQETPVFI